MADYDGSQSQNQQQQQSIQMQMQMQKESALQAVNTIIQLHFEKTLEKKRSIDLQKKSLHTHFLLFFLFLALVFHALSQTHSSSRLQCRHAWAPILLLSASHLLFYVSVAQTLRCINGFKYQRRCHKLTLALATDKLRRFNHDRDRDLLSAPDLDIHYQEPPEAYLGKFKRNWALHFGFLVFVYGFMIATSVVLLCY